MIWLINCLCTILCFICCWGYELESSQRFCVSEDSLSISNTNGTAADYKYELAPVVEDERIELQCGICNDKNAPTFAPRLWYQRKVEDGTWREVELGMKAPLTENRVYVTASHTLVIQKYETAVDTGHYNCRTLEDDVEASYLLEGLVSVNLSEPFLAGNKSTWFKFEMSLEPLEAVLDQLAADDAPDVALLWSLWGRCEDCGVTGMGEKWRRGRCQVLSPGFINLLPYNLTAVSCRSPLLELLNMTSKDLDRFQAVPDFILYEECECRHEEFTEITHEKLNSELNDGDDLSLVCPGAAGSLGTVTWKKGLSAISSEGWTMVGRGARMRVDMLGVLRIERADPACSGSYTCQVSGRTSRFFITVKAAYARISEEFQRNVYYQFAVLAVTFVLYVAYMTMLCLQPPHLKQAILERQNSRQQLLKEEA